MPLLTAISCSFGCAYFHPTGRAPLNGEKSQSGYMPDRWNGVAWPGEEAGAP